MHESDYEQMYKIINDLEREYSGKMNILRSANEAVEMRHHQQSLNSSVIIRPDGSVRLDCTPNSHFFLLAQAPTTQTG